MSQSIPYILVADDDSDDFDFLASSFSRKFPQVKVRYVPDGQAAIDYLATCLREDLPFLLLLDYKMPIVSAPAVLLYLNSNDRFTSMICAVWSTAGRTEEIQECEALGADRFFIKPASDEEWDTLAGELCQYLDATDQPDPIAQRV